MDDIDRTILGALQADGRAGFAEVGRAAGLAASSVHDRVRKLEREGVITGYRAVVDHERAGLPITAIVSLALTPASPADIPARIGDLPIVESCYSIAGDNSYALLVRAPSTSALEALLDTLRATLAVSTRATIVLSVPFEGRPVTA